MTSLCRIEGKKSAASISFVIAGLVFGMLLLGSSAAQEASPSETASERLRGRLGTPCEAAPEAVKEECRAAMERWARRIEEMEAMDARLEEKVAVLKQAGDGEKMGLMADVVAEMAVQRRAYRKLMVDLHLGLVHHMLDHMGTECRRSMHGCPVRDELEAALDESGESKPEE